MKPELEKRCNEITKDLVSGLKTIKAVKKEVEQKETKKGYLLLAVFILLVLTSSRLFADCDYLVKTKKGYHFNCGKTYYSKTQAKDINKRLFKEKEMTLVLKDRKVLIKFNHYKPLSITQKLNQEQLISKDW